MQNESQNWTHCYSVQTLVIYNINEIEGTFSVQTLKPWSFVTFNIVIIHIFPGTFIEIPQVIQKIQRLFLSKLALFIDFHQFFGLLDISLLYKN